MKRPNRYNAARDAYLAQVRADAIASKAAAPAPRWSLKVGTALRVAVGVVLMIVGACIFLDGLAGALKAVF